MPALAGDVRGLALVKVQTLEQLRLWNELMPASILKEPGRWWARSCAT